MNSSDDALPNPDRRRLLQRAASAAGGVTLAAAAYPFVAFNIQWPPLLTLAMAPVLIVAYVRQARREDRELEARFGEAFARYAARVPAFIPRLRRRSAFAAPADFRA